MKQWAKSFYGSTAWENTREAFLKSKDGLCERCLQRGDIVPAKIVHHKHKLNEKNIQDPNVTLSFDNLEALCQDCHNKEHHRQKNRRYAFDSLGRVIPPYRNGE